jgi:hypothetical protein
MVDVPIATLTFSEFETRLSLVLDSPVPAVLDLCSEVVIIPQPIKLKRSQSLVVKGGTLIGECHSIFSMGTDIGYSNGPPALVLDGTTLLHTFTSEVDKRAVGAAVFVMGKARVVLTDVYIYSSAGFGLWVKHGGRVSCERVTIAHAGRSCMACFNTAHVVARDCVLSHAYVHGICVRGSATAILQNCHILYASMRACFVYQSGSLELDNCVISHTSNGSTPTVHAEGIRPHESPSLSVVGCIIQDNQGPSIVISGAQVRHDLRDNRCDGDVVVDVFVTEATVPRPWADLQQEILEHQALGEAL